MHTMDSAIYHCLPLVLYNLKPMYQLTVPMRLYEKIVQKLN